MSEVVNFQSELKKHETDVPWLRSLQERQLQCFIQRGFPTKREEHWKYTDVSQVANRFGYSAKFNNPLPLENQFDNRIVFINGHFSTEHSQLNLLPENVIFCSVRDALDKHENLIKPYLSQEQDAQQFPFAALNAALMTHGVFLFIPKNCVIKKPIHCLFVSTDTNKFSVQSRNIFVFNANSEVVLIEEYVSIQAENYFTNAVNQFFLEDNSQVNLFKIQDENAGAAHIATILVEQKQNSVFKSFNLSQGATLSRDDIHVYLRGNGASCDLNGLYELQTNGQHVDHHLFVNHLAEHGTSSMLYKGILDKKSRAVFNGKVFVEKFAQKTHAHQANHNLLLSKDAEIDTKPELEIYADDVKCAHGATVGQLDSEALFYLRSRGINKQEAKNILTQAFAEEIISKIEHPQVMQYIQQRVKPHEKL